MHHPDPQIEARLSSIRGLWAQAAAEDELAGAYRDEIGEQLFLVRRWAKGAARRDDLTGTARSRLTAIAQAEERMQRLQAAIIQLHDRARERRNQAMEEIAGLDPADAAYL